MIWEDSLRVEHAGGRLILREGGMVAPVIRLLGSSFHLALGSFAAVVLIASVATGEIRPSEPTTWWKWALLGVFVLLFTSALGGVPIWIAVRFALHDHFTIDAGQCTLAAWRGILFIPVRRECVPLSLFSEIAVRPYASRGMGGTTRRWTIALEGARRIKMICVDNADGAGRIADEIGQASLLQVHRYPEGN